MKYMMNYDSMMNKNRNIGIFFIYLDASYIMNIIYGIY